MRSYGLIFYLAPYLLPLGTKWLQDAKSCSLTLHIFSFNCHVTLYKMYSSISEALLLQDAKSYRFLSNGYVSVPNVDDKEEFNDTVKAMEIMNFTEEEINCNFENFS